MTSTRSYSFTPSRCNPDPPEKSLAAAEKTVNPHDLVKRACATMAEEVLVPASQLYDTIGRTYTATRCTEPRIAARIWAALGHARTVLNVGAGTGSYEPADRDVTAVEPSATMRAQRPAGSARCVGAAAEQLPFADQSFDAAMAVLSDHHWPDPVAGLREMRRVARRVVIFQFDVAWMDRFWLVRDYLPECLPLVRWRHPTLTERAQAIGPGWSRSPFHGTAPTDFFTHTGADPNDT